MIDDICNTTGYALNLVCRTLGYSKSSYYQASQPTKRQLEDERLGDQIEAIFHEHRGRYGYRRIAVELRSRGVECAPARIRKIMFERSLLALQPKSYRPTTSDGRADAPSPNLLEGAPLPEKVNRVWTGDITYIPTLNGWCYLAVILDLYSRRIVGWAIADNMRASLVVNAFTQALKTRQPSPGLIFHSDRGSQYGSREFRNILSACNCRQSMSERANPYHNSWTESVIGTIKRELVDKNQFANQQQARVEIFEYIESYYNLHRRHSAISYHTPSKFEAIQNHQK